MMVFDAPLITSYFMGVMALTGKVSVFLKQTRFPSRPKNAANLILQHSKTVVFAPLSLQPKSPIHAEPLSSHSRQGSV